MMTRRQRERERIEDDYIVQMRSFDLAEEYFAELRYNSNRYTEELRERLIYLTRDKEEMYSEHNSYLSEISQLNDGFQREMGYFEDRLAEKIADYRREYLQKLDDLERYPFEEE